MNLKTTLTALIGALAYVLARYGIELSADVQAAIVVLTVTLIGFFAQDAKPVASESSRLL